jgi:pimeloyl-ACP methyl ester carboxylesterase
MKLLHLLTAFALSSAPFALAQLSNFDDWAHERIQLDDVSIHFRYHGSGPPLLLVHGFPQHSLTWHTIGPILAQNCTSPASSPFTNLVTDLVLDTVIAPDIRGTGDSSIPLSRNYTAPAAGSDLAAILSYLNITRTYVFAHDKGVGLAASLALEQPSLIARLIVAEYPLPGFGYPLGVTSSNAYQNWQLAFFAVPDAAEFFIKDRERQMLSWYFWHASYAGTAAVSAEHLGRYTDEISKPGFLRAGMEYFAAAFEDEKYFTRALGNGTKRLQMPMLALGGEASFSPASLLRQAFEGVSADFVADVIPKAGHWIGDENPTWTADRAARFFGEGERIASVDLGYLKDRVTLQAVL